MKFVNCSAGIVKKISEVLLILITLFSNSYLIADEYDSWIDQTDNLRVAIDLSVGSQYDFKTNHFSHIESFGLDLHKVFSSEETGDIATLIFQGYFTKLNNVEKHPPFFKGEDDLKFICRICNINFVVLERGELNFRVGHYEMPFGLEYNLDTNGTLRQYSNGRDLGGKLDWGVTANGKFSWGGYEVSVNRGAGVDWTGDYNTYSFSGRVERNFSYASFLGFSAFYGYLEIPGSPKYVDRTRFGLDANTDFGPFAFLGEVSVGKDDDTETFNLLVEVDIQDKTEQVLAYIQFKNASHQLRNASWDNSIQTSLGLRYTPNRLWTLSGQWTHDHTVYTQAKRASLLQVQARIRF